MKYCNHWPGRTLTHDKQLVYVMLRDNGIVKNLHVYASKEGLRVTYESDAPIEQLKAVLKR